MAKRKRRINPLFEDSPGGEVIVEGLDEGAFDADREYRDDLFKWNSEGKFWPYTMHLVGSRSRIGRPPVDVWLCHLQPEIQPTSPPPDEITL